MAVVVHGHEPLEGETAFAFMVVKLRTAVDRGGLLEVLRFIAPLIPDADAFIDEFPDELDGALRIIGIPWSPPDAGLAVDIQRRLIDGADEVGVEAAWFFQTGTSLPLRDSDEDEDEIEEDDEGTRINVQRLSTSTGETRRAETSTGERFALAAVSGEIGGADVTDTQVSLASVDDETAEEDDIGEPIRPPTEPPGDDTWSHGLPPTTREVRFPVDDYPAIIDELDWEDFGIAFKLAGPTLPGETTVLLGFHTLWLAPYGDRYRNTAVTIDPRHHSAHLWVDRFAVPCKPEELVHHLLWIVARLDEVIPVLHARFAPATMAQKYAGLDEEEAPEPFVLGGNPLLDLYERGGEAAVDAWMQTQTDWSADELALMLRELAVEIVSGDDDDHPLLAQQGEDEEGGDDDDDDDDGGDDDDDEDDDADADDDDDDESEGADDEDRGRHIARQAAALLKARALAGKLDARAGDALLGRLKKPNPPRALVEIVGAVRQRNAVPALLEILEQSIDDQLVAETARALGAIGDPRAISPLADIAAATGAFVAKPAAAAALAACLASGKGSLDDADVAELLAAIVDAGEGRLDATTYVAAGRIARLLPPHRRAEARRALQALEAPHGDPLHQLARLVALQLSSPAVPPPPIAPEARGLLERALADAGASPERLRLALEIATILPDLVELHAVIPLTRVVDPEVRTAAHAVLSRLGHPALIAPIYDAAAAHRLDDAELVRRLDISHVVGRDALVAEVGRRKLPAARPALLQACHAAIAAAPTGERVFEHDRRVLAAALPILARSPDAELGAVVDRMATHPNGTLQKLARKWQHLRHDDEGIN